MESVDFSTVRRAVVMAAAIGQIASAILMFRNGFGSEGSAVARAAIAPSALVPAGYAFVIWLPIFIGSLVFGLAQWLPRFEGLAEIERVAWLAGAGFIACIVWNMGASRGPLWLTMPMIVVMFLSISSAFLVVSRSELGPLGSWMVKTPLALYAGWLTIAMFANLNEVLPVYGFRRFGLSEQPWVLGVLAVATLFALMIFWASGFFPVYGGAIIWALVAIAISNSAKEQPTGLVITPVAAATVFWILGFLQLFRL